MKHVRQVALEICLILAGVIASTLAFVAPSFAQWNGFAQGPQHAAQSPVSSQALNRVPAFGPVLSSGDRLYFPGVGGTVYVRDNPDAVCSGPRCQRQLAFFGMKNYRKRPQAY